MEPLHCFFKNRSQGGLPYHQILLDKASGNITTLAINEGIFRFKLLIYGINSAFECYQKQIEQVISGCQAAKNVSDDILFWGKANSDHDQHLDQVLQ